MIASEKSFSLCSRGSELFEAWFQNHCRPEWLLDLSGQVIELNRASIHLTGSERANWVDRKLWECEWWAERPEANDSLQTTFKFALASHAIPATFTTSFAAPISKTYRWAVCPIKNAAGTLIAWSVSGEEITDLADLERRLIAADRRRQFLDQLESSIQPLTDADAILSCVAEKLAAHLQADRCAYAEVENESLFVITAITPRNCRRLWGFGP